MIRLTNGTLMTDIDAYDGGIGSTNGGRSEVLSHG